jgi:two-component system cell cycle response regulator DivK
MATILLVEDNELNFDMLSRRLIRQGFNVIGALDGIEGVQQAQNNLPDLILMDLGLPIMDGWKAVNLLRACETTHSLPIIALTAHATVTDRKRALQEGFDGFATKPVDFQKLVELINSLLERERP